MIVTSPVRQCCEVHGVVTKTFETQRGRAATKSKPFTAEDAEGAEARRENQGKGKYKAFLNSI
jgi:hypothetical protein